MSQDTGQDTGEAPQLVPLNAIFATDFVQILVSAIIHAYASSPESGAADKGRRLTAKVQAAAPYSAPQS